MSLEPSETLKEAQRLQTVGRMSQNDKLVGIVSRSNIMHSFEILKDIERYRSGKI